MINMFQLPNGEIPGHSAAMVNHSESGQILPGHNSHHLIVVVAHKHVPLRENVKNVNFILTNPKARNLLKIWGKGVEARMMEGVGFITGLKSMWYSLSVLDT